MNTIEKNKKTVTQESIIALTEKLFNAADTHDWEAVKATMADSVYIDYSDLGGGVGYQKPAEIVAGWAAFLPGFDRTVHHPHNFAVWVADNRASATFDAIASHYWSDAEGGAHWTVFAGYDTEYIFEGGAWKLARIALNLYQQAGDQSLAEKALARMAQPQLPEPVENTNAQAVAEKFFQALEGRNFEALMATLDNQVVQNMPFAPEQFPKALEGIEAMQQQYTGVMEYQQQYTRVYQTTNDPNTVMVKFKGEVITPSGKPYNNSYVNIFTVKADKIIQIDEFFNPSVLLNGWPGLQPAHFSVHAAGASTQGGVNMKPVNFSSQGAMLKGHLFLPPGYEPTATYPGVVVTGSWTSVMDQMPDAYASQLAQQGFIALTFDFRGFGQSEGQPRQVENPTLKIEDINAAVSFLAQQQGIDATQLGGLGICASAGYMAHAAAKNDQIKRVALVAPWLHNPELAKTIYDMRPGGTAGLLKAAHEAKRTYANTGRMSYVLAASELDPLSAMYVPENAFDYYLNPAKAAGKVYDNRFAVSSWEGWLNFDGISAAQQIQQPVYIVHSEQGALPQGTKAFYEGLTSPKDIEWLNEFGQEQFYHEKAAIEAATESVVQFLAESLAVK